MIDWEKFADLNGLTPKQFRTEIFHVAACLGAMELDEISDDVAMKFSCTDEVSQIEIYIKRVKD